MNSKTVSQSFPQGQVEGGIRPARSLAEGYKESTKHNQHRSYPSPPLMVKEEGRNH